MNPFINQSTNMYGISPITQALAQAMALGLQSYQQARQAKAKQLATILAMTREREKEERARKQKLEDIMRERGWKLEDILGERKYKTSERIAGETAEERKIRPQAELKPEKPEETDLQKQKRADSYFKEIEKILSKDGKITPKNASIIEYWIGRFNEVSNKPIVIKKPPLPKLTYELLEMEYPEYSATIVNGRKNKLSPEETLNKIAIKIIKKERAKELTWKQRKFTDWGYEPSPKELSEVTRDILADILAGKREVPTLEFGIPEELSQPVQNWKSVIP